MLGDDYQENSTLLDFYIVVQYLLDRNETIKCRYRYTKTSIWDHEQCPLDGGEFYCVLYLECPLLEVPL